MFVFLINDCLTWQLSAEKQKRDIDFHLHDERSTPPVQFNGQL